MVRNSALQGQGPPQGLEIKYFFKFCINLYSHNLQKNYVIKQNTGCPNENCFHIPIKKTLLTFLYLKG